MTRSNASARKAGAEPWRPPAERPVFDDATRAEWARYEAANRRSIDAYIDNPVTHCHVSDKRPCLTCSRRTAAHSGVCRKCRQEAA